MHKYYGRGEKEEWGGGGVGLSGVRCQAETCNRVYFGLYYSKKRTGFNTNVTNSSNQISQSLRHLPVFLRSRHEDDRNCLLTSHVSGSYLSLGNSENCDEMLQIEVTNQIDQSLGHLPNEKVKNCLHLISDFLMTQIRNVFIPNSDPITRLVTELKTNQLREK